MDYLSQINDLVEEIPSTEAVQAKKLEEQRKLAEVEDMRANLADIIEELTDARQARIALRQQEVIEEQVAPEPQPIVEETKPAYRQSRQQLYEDHLIDAVSQQISFNTRFDNKPEYHIAPLDEEQRFRNIENQLSHVRKLFHEATMVSGIGQGGDGQTPGSGEVKLARLDDVDMDNINDGDSLIWDSTSGTFVAGAGGTGGGAVSKIIAGTGIDVDPAGGVGNVEISVDLALEDLSNVNGTPSDGDLLVYNGGDWDVGHINTSQLDLTNPSTFNLPAFQAKLSVVGSYSTQEDANNIFANLIDEINLRVDELEDNVSLGTFLGTVDCTDSANEPDTSALTSGDYYIHQGVAGNLWDDAANGTVDPDNQVVWDGTKWVVVSTVTTLAQLGDTNTEGAITGDLLVYNDANTKWEKQTVPIPKVTVGTTPPNSGSEKDGDFYFDQTNEVLYIYDSVWTEVSGAGGARVVVASAPPASASEGDMYVDDDQYTLYILHDGNWIGLTNDGLTGGGDGTTIDLSPYLKKGTAGSLEKMTGSLELIGGPEDTGSNLYMSNNGFIRFGYGDINTSAEYGGYIYQRNDTLFELGTYTGIDFKINTPKTEITSEVTITTLANAGVGSVGADANGKLIILEESALPTITLNYYEYIYRSFNPTTDAALADSEMIYYQIAFESDEDHSVTVLHEIDQNGDGNWVDANTLKNSLNIVNVASTQVVFYGPKHGSFPSDTATNLPNLKIRTTLTSGAGPNEVTVATPEVDLFDGDPKKVVINARSSGEEDINGYVDTPTFEYAVSQVGKRIQSIVAESSDFADFQTRIAAINF